MDCSHLRDTPSPFYYLNRVTRQIRKGSNERIGKIPYVSMKPTDPFLWDSIIHTTTLILKLKKVTTISRVHTCNYFIITWLFQPYYSGCALEDADLPMAPVRSNLQICCPTTIIAPMTPYRTIPPHFLTLFSNHLNAAEVPGGIRRQLDRDFTFQWNHQLRLWQQNLSLVS